MDSFLLLTRAGFEGDCAAELADRTSGAGGSGYPQVRKGEGWLVWRQLQGEPLAVVRPMPVFARTAWPILETLELPGQDRISPILDALEGTGSWTGVRLEHPDTNEGRALQRFLRGFRRPLEKTLRNRGMLTSHGEAVLNLFFADSRQVTLGWSQPPWDCGWGSGIPRLRLARQAPSRSALKLEEAWLRLFSPEERQHWLRAGRTAVDLGAAPGGWTWQLARHGLRVTAVDHGMLDEGLLREYPVEHLRADAYTWRPKGTVDWLVCDVVDKPARTLALMEKWLAGGRARLAVFNLKLPMKQRYRVVEQSLGRLRAMSGAGNGGFSVRAAQLYHDRDEITVAVLPPTPGQ